MHVFLTYQDAFEIDPLKSDTVDLPRGTRAFSVNVTGDIKYMTRGGTAVVFNAQAGIINHGVDLRRVYTTGTAASGILGYV